MAIRTSDNTAVGVVPHTAARTVSNGDMKPHAPTCFAAPFCAAGLRTPVQTFIVCPLAVIAFELALAGGKLTLVPWGAPLLAWGYLQYRLIRDYRIGAPAGGSACMDAAGAHRPTNAPIALRAIRCISGTSSSWRVSR